MSRVVRRKNRASHEELVNKVSDLMLDGRWRSATDVAHKFKVSHLQAADALATLCRMFILRSETVSTIRVYRHTRSIKAYDVSLEGSRDG